MAEVIRLCTGYEIEMIGEWQDHLARALFGEVLLQSLPDEEIDDWDRAFKLLILECERIAIIHELPFSSLILTVIEKTNELFREIEKEQGIKPPKGLMN